MVLRWNQEVREILEIGKGEECLIGFLLRRKMVLSIMYKIKIIYIAYLNI